MKLQKLLIAAVIAVSSLFLAPNANAEFRFGVKGGVNVNSLQLNTSTFDNDNRTGWTAGVTTEFTVPVVGIGFDLSAMYVRRNASVVTTDGNNSVDRSYIEIPLNLKYKLSIPAISSFIKPYVATGPSVSILTSRKVVDDLYHNRSLDWSWNIGFGVELLKHLQVGANYGIGINNALRLLGTDAQNIDAKNRSWTVTAAYLF